MNLLFENFFGQLEALSYEQIKFEYWDMDREVQNESERENQEKLDEEDAAQPVKEVKESEGEEEKKEETFVKRAEPHSVFFEKFFEQQYFVIITAMFKRYFQQQYLDLLEDERPDYLKFLELGYDPVLQKKDKTNYREAIAETIFLENKFKPVNFDYLLVLQYFVTSMRAADPVISVKISDMLDVYNTLVINKEVKWVEGADRSVFAEPLESLR